MDAIQQETADITTLINNLLMNSSKQRGSLDDTNARYEQYMSRHETLQQEKLELAKHDGPLTAFDPLVFQKTVNYVTVNEDCTVTFLFRDGTEATQIIEKGVRQYVRRQPKHNGDTPTDGDSGEST